MIAVPRREGEAGLTLVEMLVALALFALVGFASFAMLDTVIRTRDRTEGRLETIAAFDRALILWSRDLGQSDPGGLSIAEGVLSFGEDSSGGLPEMSYTLVGGALARRAGLVEQRLAAGIASLSWRGLDSEGAWHEDWPPETEAAPLVGLEMRLTLTGNPPATIRRVVELPLVPSP